MERLFELLSKHRDDILKYNIHELYDDSLNLFRSGITHIDDDLFRFIEKWDSLLVGISDREDITGRIFQFHQQIGLSLDTFVFSYIVSQTSEKYQNIVSTLLGVGLELVEQSKGVYPDKSKYSDRCKEITSGLSNDGLNEMVVLIENKYNEFFQVFGRDYQEARSHGDETDLMNKWIKMEREGNPPSEEERERDITKLHEAYRGEDRHNKYKLISKVRGVPYGHIKDTLCEILKNYS